LYQFDGCSAYDRGECEDRRLRLTTIDALFTRRVISDDLNDDGYLMVGESHGTVTVIVTAADCEAKLVILVSITDKYW